MKNETSYATTDLEIWASFDLTPIADQLIQHGLIAYHVGPVQEGRWSARFTSAHANRDPDSEIAEMLTAIERLDASAKSQWTACNERNFDIAFYCGVIPIEYHQSLLPETLARIAVIQAGIVITIYPELETDAVIAAIAILKKDKWIQRQIGKYSGHGTHFTDSSTLKKNQAEVKVTLNGKKRCVFVHCLMELTMEGEWGLKGILQQTVHEYF
jgi:hypothetical protein